MTAEIEARNFLDELGITQLPVIPKYLCKNLGIVYKEDPLKNIDGMLLLKPNVGALISVNSQITEDGRKNFTCAHELGHFCMDGDAQSEFYCSKDAIENFRYKALDIELRANRFAAELLMPKFIVQEFVNNCEPSWEQIKELSAMSGASLLSAAIRFVDLNEYACALVVIEKNKIAWFRKSQNFKPFITMDTRLVSEGTIAYSAIQNRDIADGYSTVKADCWVSGRGVDQDTEILEWTLPRSAYDQIFTLLFDEDGIAGWDEEDMDEDDEIKWEPPTFHKSKRK